MKTLGILGGVGPQTTSEVYLSVIDLIRKSGAETYPSITIYNLPFPFIIEKEAIIQGINSEKMIPYLVEGAKILEKAGADFGILPCNTLHTFMPEIRRAVTIPFLSIVEETIQVLKSKKIKTVGILATQTTIDSKLYENALRENGIEPLNPTEKDQHRLTEIIVELLNNFKNDSQVKKIQAVCDTLHEQGAESILLACTDLQLAIADVKSPVPIIDTTDILINATVNYILKT